MPSCIGIAARSGEAESKSSLTSKERSRERKRNCVKDRAIGYENKGEEKKEANKGVRGMPRLSEATKDVVSCEKLRGVANKR